MGIINLLSSDVSNKIAAGEVVERPASVVKELVENSIDSGATVIVVRIERGGMARIQVTDNGCGMMKEDAVKCFERHATSKISSAEDLNSIYTMGFRGEALSSIGAVAQVDLYTKREQDTIGTHVFFSGGELQSCVDEGMPNGTTFVVTNIFYNVPVRMKFLKTDRAESAAIKTIMEKFILSHPEISFRFINSRKEIFFSSGDGKLINCIYAVYGKDYAKNVIPVDYKKDYISVKGYIGKSELARGTRDYQSFFVNKRYIKSRGMEARLSDAYKNQIMVGKFPMAVLNVEIDASLVDINVHPNKQEVKFSNEGEIYSAVFHAAENALYSDYSIPKIERAEKKISPEIKKEMDKSDAQYKLEWEKNKDRWSPAEEVGKYKKEPPDYEEMNKHMRQNLKLDVSKEYFQKRKEEILKEEYEPKNAFFLNEPDSKANVPGYFESRTPFADALRAKSEMTDNAENEKITYEIVDEKEADKDFSVIGQVFNTYVLVERGNEMLIIDQHAAHERIKYEEIKKELEAKAVAAQDLLIPLSVKLSSNEYAVYSDNLEFLNELGFEADEFGENTIVIRTAPAYVEYDDIEQVFDEIMEQISRNKNKPMAEKAEYAVYTIACKAAIKANHKLDMKELEALAEKVFALGSIKTCPHGRPITVSMSKKELEKEFKRIV